MASAADSEIEYHSKEYPGLSGFDRIKLRMAELKIAQIVQLADIPGPSTCLRLNSLNLSSLPGPTLSGLACMTELRCSDNRLRRLPPELERCAGLKLLDCSHNWLGSLPPELGNCSGLVILICEDAGLESLPAELGKCTSLYKIVANSNLIKRIPPELGECQELGSICCSNNQLETIPPELGKCPKLFDIYVIDNPLAEGETTDPVELRRRWSERPHTKAAGRY